ncbi:MAG: hypothetical protein WCO71_08180 [Pseudomonadota bacterium]
MLTVLRWIVFLPGAFIASFIMGCAIVISENLSTSMFFWSGFFSSEVSCIEFIFFVACGAMFSWVFIFVGIFLAPVRSEMLKWILIIIAILCGVIDAYVNAYSDDKLKMATGISMVLVSLFYRNETAKEIAMRHS